MKEESITSTLKPQQPPLNLFDYSEDDLLKSNVLTYYEILNCPPYATQNEVKKAYRKASLRYHPDKTGRGEDDYVFLAVKAAHDTLMDHAKRQAYDSTVLPFDDSIPPTRDKLLQDPNILYNDDDFYSTFGPVFERNLRFDARLRPDLVKGTNSKKVNQKNHNHAHEPPTLGDANTPLANVHAFYEYWVRFDSWRDFSSQAADDLQIDNELENAESRFEKRWLQKEIDKRAKQLKRAEMQRIQTLVERAMDADPRLRLERQQLQLRKEQAAAERAALQIKQQNELEQHQKLQAEQAELEKERKQQEKITREKEKKLLRKERQLLRKQAQTIFQNDFNFQLDGIWNGSYDMSQDIDYLCNTLELDAIKQFNEQFLAMTREATTTVGNSNGNQAINSLKFKKEALIMIHDRATSGKLAQEKENEQKKQQQIKYASEHVDDEETTGITSTNATTTSANKILWTKDEMSALAKAVRKYPPGGGSRWEAISLFVNNICKQQNPRSKEECIEKYNQITKQQPQKEQNQPKTSPNITNVGTLLRPANSYGISHDTTHRLNTVDMVATTNAPKQSLTANVTVAKISTDVDGKLHQLLNLSNDNAEATKTNSNRENGFKDSNHCKKTDAGHQSMDFWTEEQDKQLQDALSKYPATMDKNERWTSIAKFVSGKSKKDCVTRFKMIREEMLASRSMN